MAKRSFLILGTAAAISAGCSVLIDVDGKQCEADADCATRGFANATCEQNLCVEKIAPVPGDGGAGGGGGDENPLICETPEPNDATTVKFSFAPGFAVAPADPKPFSVKVCVPLDPECEAPIIGPVDVNALEPYEFELPKAFNGFFQIENPDTRTGLYYMGRPVNQDTIGWNVTMPSDSTITALGFAAGKQVHLELGVMIAVARDCNLVPLEGAVFENSELESTPDGLRFYFYQTMPDVNATKTGPQGAVGYANLPIGTATLGATAADGTPLTPVAVRLKAGGFVSFIEVFP
jgi:hypothetical protein